MSASPPQRERRRVLLAFTVLLALAAVLRLWQIDTQSSWIDEANGIRIAEAPLSEIPRHLRVDGSPPLYYLLLYFWTNLFGSSEVAVRGLSVLFSLVLIGLTFESGRRCFSTTPGFLAGLYLAVAPSQVFYSQQARMYTLLPVLALGSTMCLVRFLRTPRGVWLFGFAACTAAALLTHNFAIFLLPLQAVLVLSSGRLVSGLRSWCIAYAGIALVYLPWLPVFLAQLHNADHYAWFRGAWRRQGVAQAVWNSVTSLSPASGCLAYEGVGGHDAARIPAALCLVAAAFGAVDLLRRAGLRRRVDLRDPTLAWPLALVLVPAGCSLLSSVLVQPNFVAGRVDQMLIPGWSLLVALGIAFLTARIRSARWRTALVTVLALAVATLGVRSIATMYTDPRARGFRGAERELARELAHRLRSGDAVLFTSLSRATVQYYLRESGVTERGSEVRFFNYPEETASHLGSQNDRRLLQDPPALERAAESSFERARAAVAPGRRIHLVLVTPSDGSKPRVNEPLLALVRRPEFARNVRPNGTYLQCGTGLAVTLLSITMP